MPQRSLGEFEHLVMLAIVRIGPGAYGVTIAEEVEARSGRSVNQAAVYMALRRIEEKGWATSEWGEPSHTRGGRAKRHFALTAPGLERLRIARAELDAMYEGIREALDG